MSEQPRRGPLNTYRRYIEREPIKGRPELEDMRADHEAHVNAVRRQGGFKPLFIYAQRYA